MSQKKIYDILDKYLIPDITDIVLKYLSCPKCKVYYNGWNKCICRSYMCECNIRTKCNDCEKIICQECNNLKVCCNETDMLCGYCKNYIYNIDNCICIFGDCDKNICKNCFEKFNGLCRGHKLLKKYEPEHKEFDGIIGL